LSFLSLLIAFHFVILGDLTGEAQPGIFEQVAKKAAAENPAFIVGVGDMIQGLDDSRAESEWREAKRILAPLDRFPLYLAPGNHDIWSALSEALFVKYSGHALHYGFDYGGAHFTVLDDSRSDSLSAEELAFLESDLKAHAAQHPKFIVSHRPSWIVPAMLRNPNFPLHQLARRYGVQYIIAGHIHQLIHISLDGIDYVSMPSAGGHLRASGRYDDGWFFGYAGVDVNESGVTWTIHDLAGHSTSLDAWGPNGLAGRK
jgi:3',5'-cyclic AMP phosphodiesterase CpdA